MRPFAWLKRVGIAGAGLLLVIPCAWAQQPAASTPPPSPDTPSFKVGVSLYTDYTYTKSPQITDTDGNLVSPSQFNIGRSYINFTGNLSHIVSFRITPDITRETGAGSALNGSLTFRMKYGFAQFNLDQWMTPGSWTRLGIQQTPWVDFEENIYRYRWQGTVFPEREGFMSSSDAGASFHYNLPSNYGDVHVGVYNGENYFRQDPNDQKAVEVRGSVRPFAAHRVTALRGLRAHLFFTGDHYVKDAVRRRVLGGFTFEHKYLNAGLDYLKTTDQTSVLKPEVDGSGFSFWATPRSPSGWELLLRYDRMRPDTSVDAQVRNRTIVGIAYWFPVQSGLMSAVMFDYDGANFNDFTPAQPKQQRFAVHTLVQF